MAKETANVPESETTPGTDLEVFDPERIQLAIMGQEDLPEIEDDDEAFIALAMQIANARDMEGVFSAFETTPGQDIIGMPIEVHEIRWRPSEFESAAKCYAIVKGIRLDSGDEVVFSTGGRSVMMALLKAQALGQIPFRFKLGQSRRARPGRSPALRFERV